MQYLYEGLFDTKNSGKITVRAVYGQDNRLSRLMNLQDCNTNDPNGGTLAMDLHNVGECITEAGQPIEYCKFMYGP